MTGAVEIGTRDGVVLRGELSGEGPVWLVLAHEAGADLDAWAPLSLAGRGLSVLAVDLRGHGGSDGDAEPGLTSSDLVDVSGFARAHGAAAVVLGAAGESVPPALEAAGEAEASGVIAIAPRGPADGGGSSPKLVIVAAQDDRQVATATALQGSPGSAVVISLPIAGGPAEIVSGSWRTNVEAYIAGFVRDVARPVTGVIR